MKHRCYYLHCWFATKTKCENSRSTIGSSAKLSNKLHQIQEKLHVLLAAQFSGQINHAMCFLVACRECEHQWYYGHLILVVLS
jgi:hypothetical protein